MSDIFLSIIYIIVFLFELIPAVFVMIASRDVPENRALALLFTVFALNSLSYGSLIGVFSIQEALPWIAIFVISTYAIGPATYIASVAVLRPRWLRHKWLFYPVYLLLALPVFFVFLDITGLSTFITSEPLIFTPPDPNTYAGGVITLGETAYGLLSPAMLIVQIGFPLLAFICPMLVVGIKDWKSNPVNSRIAWLFALATGIATFSQVVLADFITPKYSSIIANVGFILLFGLASLRRSKITWNLRSIRRSLDDWPVFAKLVLVVITVFLPTIFIITLVSASIVRVNMTEQIGSSFYALARLESRNIANSLRIQSSNLEGLSQSPVLLSTLHLRAQETQDYDEAELENWLNTEELDWVLSDQSMIERTSGDFLPAISTLVDFRETFPAFTYLQLTDASGGLVSATSTPTHFDYSNAGWWRAAYNDGEGSTFYSVPLRDLESDSYYIQFALPIYNSSENSIAGILLGHYLLDEIFDNLAATQIGDQGHSDLFSPNGTLIQIDELNEGTREVILPWTELENDPDNWRILVYEGTSSIVSWTTIADPQVETALNWRLTIHQPISEALRAVGDAQQASLLTTVITSVLGFGLAWVLSGFITQPIYSLTEVAQKVLEGDLNVRSNIIGKDEVGILANTFNTMTARVRDLVNNLEKQVKERTADLERQTQKLQAASEVGQGVISILNTTDLIRTTVDIIRERFDLYYVGLFLVDEDGEWAVLQAGTGIAGEQMLARGHRLRIGEGMIGWSIKNAQARVAADVAADIVQVLTPELPGTRSEAAIPMRARGQTIGALTVQSTRAGEFDKVSVNILQSLADQVGIAIDNVNLLEQNQAALQESRQALETVRRTYQQVTRESWTETTQQQQWSLVATPDGLRWRKTEDTAEDSALQANGAPELSVPIRIRDHSIGTIRLRKPAGTEEFTTAETQYIENYMGQLGLALDSARLFQDIQKRSLQLETSAQVGRTASSILRLDELLPAAVSLIGERFNLYYAGVFLVDEDKKWAVLQAGTGEAGEKQLAANHRLEVGGKSMIGQAVATGEARIAMDVGDEPAHFENPVLPLTRTEMALPLMVGSEAIGAVTIQSTKPAAFTRADITVFQTMANQLATAIQNARLYEQSQQATDVALQQRRIADALLKSSSRFATTQDQEVINDILIEEIDDQVRPDQINIFLWNGNIRKFTVVRRYVPGDPEDDYEVGQHIAPDDVPLLWKVYTESEHIYHPESRSDGFIHEQYRLPLRLANQPIGVVEIFHTAQDAHITPEDRAVIDGILQQASVAVQSARTFRQTQEALARTEALYLVGQATTSMDNLGGMLQTVADTIAETLPADRVLISLVDMQRRRVTGLLQSNVPASSLKLVPFDQVMGSLAGWVLREQRHALTRQGEDDPRESPEAQEMRRRSGEGSRLIVPLVFRGRILGTITASNNLDHPDFSEQDAELLTAMALQIAVAVQNTELYTETQKTALNERLLNQIGSQLTQSLDFETILRTAVEEIGQLPNIKNVTLTVGEKKPKHGDKAK